MLYSPKHNLAFLHIHKIGGTSFRDFLQRAIPDMQDMPELPEPHYTVQEFFSALKGRGLDPSTSHVLTIIRNPLAHIVSIYHYWRGPEISPELYPDPPVSLARELSFPDFIRA